jgi:thioredoxin 1
MKPSSPEAFKTTALFILFALTGAAIGWILLPASKDTSPARSRPPATYSRGEVEQISEDTFDERVLGSQIPVLVDFYADWCGPCQQLVPVLEELARETPAARIVKVNVDQNRALAARYSVHSIPRLMVFKDGQIAAEHTGSTSKNALKSMLGLQNGP